MTGFNQAIEAQFAGSVVRLASLVHFDFLSGPVRLWPGFGDLSAGGETWKGIGALGALSAINSGPGQTVEEMTFHLGGGSNLFENFIEDANEATGREVNVFLQFFDIRKQDENGVWVDWATLDDPFQVFWGTMGPLVGERQEAGDDAMSARVRRIVSVTASNAFVNRARPAYGYFSHRDQQARHPGDNIFISISSMAHATVRWPFFS